MLFQRREEKSQGKETEGHEDRKRRESGEGGMSATRNRESRVKEDGKNRALSRGRDKAS